MSGGAYDYAYLHVLGFADLIFRGRTSDGGLVESATRESERRQALVKHLEKVAAVMKAIEWVDSGDSGPEVEERACQAVLGPSETVPIHGVKAAMDRIEGVLKALEGVVKELSGSMNQPILNDLRYVLIILMGIYEDRDKV